MNKNDICDLYITDLGNDGEGIGRIDDFVLFVPGALPGDFCRVKIIKLKKSYGYGRLMEIIKPSENRVEPLCPVFNKCGGCSIMHLDYETGLKFKHKKVKDSLERIGGFKGVDVEPVVPMDKLSGYRNKAQIPVREKNGEIQMGFFLKNSHDVVPVDNCFVQQPVVADVLKAVKNYMYENNVRAYDEKNNSGVIRHILVKSGFKTKEVMVCLIVNLKKNQSLKNQNKLIDGLSEIANVKSISLNYNTAADNVILGEFTKNIWGTDHIKDYIGDILFEISPLSFFQVNPVQTEKMYQKIAELLGDLSNGVIIDAFCGIGSISLFLAKNAKKVIGIEIVPDAIKNAVQNASLNNIQNTEFICGKSEEIIYDLMEKGVKSDVIITDPPRKGCEAKFLDAVLKIRPKKFIYVSCNPDTLARDLKILSAEYKIEKVCPFDMFSLTNHVECIVLMSKKEDEA